MANFNISLTNFLKENFPDFHFFSESAPEVRDNINTIVLVASGSENTDSSNLRRSETKRFLVSGKAGECLQKSEQIFDFLVSKSDNVGKVFSFDDFIVFTTIAEQRPKLANNVGNIFFAEFSIRFLIAEG